jgi:hypothetical protein
MKSQNSTVEIKVFRIYFCLMMEEYGSRRSKNLLITVFLLFLLDDGNPDQGCAKTYRRGTDPDPQHCIRVYKF